MLPLEYSATLASSQASPTTPTLSYFDKDSGASTHAHRGLVTNCDSTPPNPQLSTRYTTSKDELRVLNASIVIFHMLRNSGVLDLLTRSTSVVR